MPLREKDMGYKFTNETWIEKQIGEKRVIIIPDYTDHLHFYLTIKTPTWVGCRSCHHADENEDCTCKCKECNGKESYKNGENDTIAFSIEDTKTLFNFLRNKVNLASKRAWNGRGFNT